MPSGLMHWTFDDVVKVLKEHRFIYNYTNGSHYFYIGSAGGLPRQISAFSWEKGDQASNNESIILQSGIAKEKWLN